MVLGKNVIIRCVKFPLEVQLQYAIKTDAVARTGNWGIKADKDTLPYRERGVTANSLIVSVKNMDLRWF